MSPAIGHVIPAVVVVVSIYFAPPLAAQLPARSPSTWPSPIRRTGGSEIEMSGLEETTVQPIPNIPGSTRPNRRREHSAGAVRVASALSLEGQSRSRVQRTSEPLKAGSAERREPRRSIQRLSVYRTYEPETYSSAHRRDAVTLPPAHRVLEAPHHHHVAGRHGTGHPSSGEHRMDDRGEPIHPPHSELARQLESGPPTIPEARQRAIWKAPYSYGYFGAERNRHWSLHHGFREKYTEWRLW